MATTNLTNAFISLHDVINNFIISYTGPGKLIPDSKRTEVVFHARRCLQEFAYETLKSQFTITLGAVGTNHQLPGDFVSIISVIADENVFSQVEFIDNSTPPGSNNYSIDYSTNKIWFDPGNQTDPDCAITYLSNALTTDENAAIPKLAEEALYACASSTSPSSFTQFSESSSPSRRKGVLKSTPFDRSISNTDLTIVARASS